MICFNNKKRPSPRLVSQDILQDRCDPKLTKEGVTAAIARALVKRRLTNLFATKLKGKDVKGGTYQPGYAPSQVFSTIFSSMAAFRATKLHETAYTSLSWVSQLPAWQVEVLQFGAKLLRGSPAVDAQLDQVLATDPLIPAEALFQSDLWQEGKLFDFRDMLEQRKAAMQPAPEPEPKVQEPEPIKEVQETEAKNQDTSEEPEAMPQIMADVEEDEAGHKCVPQKVDRLASFNLLELPTDVVSVLQGGDDNYFEQVLDWARVRVNTFVDLEVKARNSTGRRQQVKELYERHGGTPFFIIYDVKCRLHLKDDLISHPWKRPTPLNSNDFKYWLSAFWLDPKLTLALSKCH